MFFKKNKKNNMQLFSEIFFSFICSLSSPMPGRREDTIWNAFIKKKPEGKQYFVGECKGCKEVIAGVLKRDSSVQNLTFRPHRPIETTCNGVFQVERDESFGTVSCKTSKDSKAIDVWGNNDQGSHVFLGEKMLFFVLAATG